MTRVLAVSISVLALLAAACGQGEQRAVRSIPPPPGVVQSAVPGGSRPGRPADGGASLDASRAPGGDGASGEATGENGPAGGTRDLPGWSGTGAGQADVPTGDWYEPEDPDEVCREETSALEEIFTGGRQAGPDEVEERLNRAAAFCDPDTWKSFESRWLS